MLRDLARMLGFEQGRDIKKTDELLDKRYENLSTINTNTIVGLYLSALINKSTVNEFHFKENHLDYFLYRLDSNKEVMIDRNNGRYVGAKQKGKIEIKYNEGDHVGEGQEGEFKIDNNHGEEVGIGQRVSLR